MNHRNNRRSEATKTKIKQTLVDMLHTQDINKITVQALCELASINRSTFYNHYESPEAVLDTIECEFIAKLEEHLLAENCLELQNGNFITMIAKTLEFLQMNKNICFLIKTSNLRPTFKKNIFREIFKTSLMNHSVFDKYDQDSLPYAQAFILYGCGHTIDLWLNRGCEESPQEIAVLLANFITRL